MQHIAFCSRCRGMKVGWNLHYIGHCVICKKLVSKSFKLLILTVLTCVLALAFSAPGALVFSEQDTGHRIQQAAAAVPAPLLVRVDPAILVRVDPAVKEMDSFLERYKVEAGQ